MSLTRILMHSTSSLSQLHFKPNLPIFTPQLKNNYYYCHPHATRSGKISSSRPIRKSVLQNSNQRVVETSSTAPPPSIPADSSAAMVVRKFYEGINGHDLESVEKLIAENCVYEDLIFPQPFVGRKAILEFFNKFIDSISTDLQFVIDDISEDDASRVGVTWHLEWKGKPFPFSKGCSFYRLEVVNGQPQISYGRDSVEPAIKPGESALIAIRGVTWLLQQFPQLAERL